MRRRCTAYPLTIGRKSWQSPFLAASISAFRHPREELGQVLELRADDPLLADAEVATCFGPLQSVTEQQDGADTKRRGVFIIPLEVPGKGTIGFCAGGGQLPARRLRQAVRRALQALAAQGAMSLENLHLYRLQQDEAAVSSALLQVAGAVGTTDIDLLVQRTLKVLPGSSAVSSRACSTWIALVPSCGCWSPPHPMVNLPH